MSKVGSLIQIPVPLHYSSNLKSSLMDSNKNRAGRKFKPIADCTGYITSEAKVMALQWYSHLALRLKVKASSTDCRYLTATLERNSILLSHY